MLYIGIDCGLNGGIAAVTDTGHVSFMETMPVLSKGKGNEIDILRCKEIIVNLLIVHPDAKATIENPGGHAPSAAGLRSMTYSFAVMKTIVVMRRIPHQEVLSQKWQSKFWTKQKTAKGTKFDTKGAALSVATRLFPNVDFRKNERSSKAHDGIVDAVLLAEYGRLTMD